MNKAESKYFNTALLMNQALIELLDKKDYEFITIKEICNKAGVNRSTFYLHYECVNDLLNECIENSNNHFLTYFNINNKDFFDKIANCPLEELMFITPEYLIPYLNYIKDNKIIYKVAHKHSILMNSNMKFDALNKNIFRPILRRFEINEKTADYMMQYYINGLSAIINEWIKTDCKDEMDYIIQIMINCVSAKK